MPQILSRQTKLAAVARLEVAVARRFRELYGQRPAGVWAAPGRVNLIGEHTDYNQGFVLPFALPRRTYVAAAAPGGPPRWSVWSSHERQTVSFGPADLRPGAMPGWASYVAGVVWVLRALKYEVPAANLAVMSDVPVGAGLSSSAAIECAVLTALVELFELDLAVPRRPRVVQRAENQFVGVPSGIMDQSAAILSRAGHALFLDCRSLAIEQVPLRLTDLSVLVIDTRAPHRLVTGEYAVRRDTCERAAAALGVPALRDVSDLGAALARLQDSVARKRVRHVVTENQRVLDTVALLRNGSATKIGPLLSASHASLRDDYQVTVPELDLAAETAESAGAYGARMTGGGFGGCVIALVDTDAADRIAEAVVAAFAARGFTRPDWFTATPSPGATRVS
jgi:galactokinase